MGSVHVPRQVWLSSSSEQEEGSWAGVGAPFLSLPHLLRAGQQQLGEPVFAQLSL